MATTGLRALSRRLSTAPGRLDLGVGTYERMRPVEGAGAKKYSATIMENAMAGQGGQDRKEVLDDCIRQMLHTNVAQVPGGITKPQVGISSVWYDGNPCNMHLLKVSEVARDAAVEMGMVPLRFNSIGVSDGISNGTDGMSYSLQSRDLIADGIETMMASQFYDANFSIPGCDKNMPGCVMAMGRVNRPSVMVYGGTIRAGCRPQMDVRCASPPRSVSTKSRAERT